MRRLSLICLFAALAVTAPPAGAAQDHEPTLELAGNEPLVMAGRNFLPRERVRVVARLDGKRRTRMVRAGREGGFRATFAGMVVRRCGGSLRVTAVGSRGNHASFHRRQIGCPRPEPLPKPDAPEP